MMQGHGIPEKVQLVPEGGVRNEPKEAGKAQRRLITLRSFYYILRRKVFLSLKKWITALYHLSIL